MKRLSITGVPPGEAPQAVREAWVGVVIPLLMVCLLGCKNKEFDKRLFGIWELSTIDGSSTYEKEKIYLTDNQMIVDSPRGAGSGSWGCKNNNLTLYMGGLLVKIKILDYSKDRLILNRTFFFGKEGEYEFHKYKHKHEK